MKRISPKLIGEWVEMKFIGRAADERLTISKPYGDSAPFDFIVGSRQPLHRVQVRRCSRVSNRSYVCRITRGLARTRCTREHFDFLVAYVRPHDAWYVIPMDSLGSSRWVVCLFPHTPNSRGRLEKFREAWHLLSGTRPGVSKSFMHLPPLHERNDSMNQ